MQKVSQITTDRKNILLVKRDDSFTYFYVNGEKVIQVSNIIVKNNYDIIGEIIHKLLKTY